MKSGRRLGYLNFMTTRLILSILALGLGIADAAAQSLRSQVVPADATVAIAPRGQALPPAPTPLRAAGPSMMAAPAAVIPMAVTPLAAMPLAAMPLGAGVGLLLPLVAGVLLGGGLPGSGGGTSAPANTR